MLKWRVLGAFVKFYLSTMDLDQCSTCALFWSCDIYTCISKLMIIICITTCIVQDEKEVSRRTIIRHSCFCGMHPPV